MESILCLVCSSGLPCAQGISNDVLTNFYGLDTFARLTPHNEVITCVASNTWHDVVNSLSTLVEFFSTH